MTDEQLNTLTANAAFVEIFVRALLKSDGNRPLEDVMAAAATATGLRRAAWATIPQARRERIQRRAMREWRAKDDS